MVDGLKGNRIANGTWCPTTCRVLFAVESVLDERGVEEGEDAEDLFQRLFRVHVRRGVQVAVP